MSCRILDMNSYRRSAHFAYFRSLSYPYVGTTVSVDVTRLVHACRHLERSFYITFLHAAALAADGVTELRQRIRGDQIVEYNECPTSHIELLDDGSYCYCTLHHHMDMESYYLHAEQARQACCNNGIQEDEDVESMYFISALPWLHYTALIQPVAGGDESNPRITWGKYEAGPSAQLLMPVTLLAHHALVDGLQLSQFYQRLNEEIARLSEMLQ